MSKRTQKKILSKVADIQKSMDIIARAVQRRTLQREITRREAETELKRRVKVERRFAYVHAANQCAMDLNTIRIAISEVARQRGEFPPPSLITVLRWQGIINSSGTFAFHVSGNGRRQAQQTNTHRFYEE